MKNNFTVSVVLPNFNGEVLLAKNLPRIIEELKNPVNAVKEIIIVDDASEDGSVKFISSNFPEVRLIKHKVNRGFSSSVNTGVRSAKGDLILLLNTDVSPEKNFLSPTIFHFEDPKVFAVSLHEEGFGWAKGSFSNGYVQLGMGTEDKSSHISFYVSGGSGLFRTKYWKELGGMDEKLFSPYYWEDIDLSYRASKRGLINLWEPNSKVIHRHESTISKLPKPRTQLIKERNYLLFMWKNIGSPELFRKHLIGMFLRALKHPGYIRVILMAFGKLGVALGRRKKELREAKVSDEAIFARY